MSVKMLKFELRDGKTVSGDTYKEIVQDMADEKLTTPGSLLRYRRATAKRIKQSFGLTIRFRGDENFVQDLLAADLMREV